MRILVGIACCSIIAVSAYYFWGEWSSYRASVQRADDRKRAEAELYDLSKSVPGDRSHVEEWCKMMRNRFDNDLKGNEYAKDLVNNCRALNFL